MRADMKHCTLARVGTWFLLGLVLSTGQLRADEDVIRYRTADGKVGFAQDRAGVPPGATVLSAPPPRNKVQIIQRSPASPARPAESARPYGKAAEEASALDEESREEGNSTRAEVTKAQAELAEAKADRQTYCGDGYYGSYKPSGNSPRRKKCYESTQKLKTAESKLQEIRSQLEEDFEDVEEYFGPEE